jgi:tetratricopeptide (TPR) repeat protein
VPGIFISYRREDSQELAGRLFDRLVLRFGKERVFRDIDAIDPGARFAEVIAERVGNCEALVALIGKGWLDAKDAQGRRRLELPNDFVKAEVAEAIAQNKLVISVLIEGTSMPSRDALPTEIASLVDRIALPVSDSRFDFDFGRLVSAIDKVVTPGITEKTLPRAVPGKFNVAVAHLVGDNDREMERLILESLTEFQSVATLSFDRVIGSEEGNREEAEREGHERARALLKSSGADVLLWGVVLRQGSKSLPKLYWTPARDVAMSLRSARYQMTEVLSLPSIFWQDLANVLALLVASSEAEFVAQEGHYTADRLAPFIGRARNLLQSRHAEHWSAATRAKVLTIFGSALTTYGRQLGQKEPLREAVTSFRRALEEYTRERVPFLDWAMTQNELGHALTILGKRESDPVLLTEAVTTFRGVLEECRERVPLFRAQAQSNLGAALLTLGERESDPALLTEAVTSFRRALEEYTREKVPLNWATTQDNLGMALSILGEWKSDPVLLTEAVTAHREALKGRRREKVPLDWAKTQDNLGTALSILGERESDPVLLAEAVTAYREALKVRRREEVPLDHLQHR